jgi:two-component system phosphate regulon sensor histidine kinase PhoR
MAPLLIAVAAAVVAAVLAWRERSRAHRLQRDLAAARRDLDQLDGIVRGLEQRNEEVSEGCGAAVLRFDRSLHLLGANRRAEEWYWPGGGSHLGLPLIQCILSDELQSAAEASVEVAEDRRLELEDVGPGNRTLQIELRPLDETELYLFAHDITESRRLARVRQDFVANVSHELRTPLASIRAMAESLEAGAMDEPKTAARFLKTIVAESDRLRRIADDLLVLSHAESQPPERSRVDLTQLVQEILERFRGPARKEKKPLHADVEDGLVVSGSRDQLDSAIANLLDNAIKYTGEGDKIAVTAKRENGWVLVSVEDDGAGILQEDLPRIFERFYRADKARSRRTGGTGLGLSIVKHVAEAHGGSVKAESEFNRGSKFTLAFPEASPQPGQ